MNNPFDSDRKYHAAVVAVGSFRIDELQYFELRVLLTTEEINYVCNIIDQGIPLLDEML